MSAILHNQFSSFCFTFEQDIVIIFLMLPFLYFYTINCIFAHFGIRCAHCLIGHFYIATMCIINWQQAVSTIMQPCSLHPFWRLILFLIYWTFSSCPYDGRGIFWDCRIIDYCRGYCSLLDTAVTSYFFPQGFGYGVIQPTPAVHVHTQVQVWFLAYVLGQHFAVHPIASGSVMLYCSHVLWQIPCQHIPFCVAFTHVLWPIYDIVWFCGQDILLQVACTHCVQGRLMCAFCHMQPLYFQLFMESCSVAY